MTMWTPDGMRIQPAMPAAAYTTYSIASPTETHTRPATCAEVECPAYVGGWVTTVDTSTDLGQRQEAFIRNYSGRHFTVEYGVSSPDTARLVVTGHAESTLVRFTFPAGQKCFASDTHRVSLDRPEIFYRRGGDWRGNPTGERYRHERPEHWVEDFAEHQDTLATELNGG